jgi:hypothetical protein
MACTCRTGKPTSPVVPSEFSQGPTSPSFSVFSFEQAGFSLAGEVSDDVAEGYTGESLLTTGLLPGHMIACPGPCPKPRDAFNMGKGEMVKELGALGFDPNDVRSGALRPTLKANLEVSLAKELFGEFLGVLAKGIVSGIPAATVTGQIAKAAVKSLITQLTTGDAAKAAADFVGAVTSIGVGKALKKIFGEAGVEEFANSIERALEEAAKEKTLEKAKEKAGKIASEAARKKLDELLDAGKLDFRVDKDTAMSWVTVPIKPSEVEGAKDTDCCYETIFTFRHVQKTVSENPFICTVKTRYCFDVSGKKPVLSVKPVFKLEDVKCEEVP